MNVTTEQVCEDLMLLLRQWKTVLVDLAEQQGVTMMQMSALYSIDTQGELPMGKVASALHCDASNVTGIIDRLVHQDLVTRTECPRDRRAKTLTLTTKGQQVVASIKAALPERLASDRLNTTDRADLHRIIRKLCA